MSKNEKKTAQNTNQNRKIQLIGMAVILAVAILIGVLVGVFAGDPTVMTVGGKKIGREEFSFYLRQHRSDIVVQYSGGYGIAEDEKFWTTQASNGSTPLSAWIDAAVEDAVYNNAIWQAAKKAGFVSFDSFADWKKDMEQENKRRIQAVQNGEVIYGPQQYDLASYLQIRIENLKEQMKKTFSQNYTPTEDEMRAYYEANKENFRAGDVRLIQQISVPYGNGIAQSNAKSNAQLIRAALVQGTPVAQVMVDYAACAQMVDKEFSGARGEWAETLETPQTYSAAIKLSSGEISEIIEENGAFYINVCVQMFPGQYQPFEASEDVISARLTDESFQDYLADLVADAQVERKEKSLEKVANSLKN